MEPTQSRGRQVTPDLELLLLIGRWRARARELLAQAEIHAGRARPADNAGNRCEI